MSVIDKLQHAGVDICFDKQKINFNLYKRDTEPGSQHESLSPTDTPLVSCLMVTRGNIQLLRYSLECYRRQTYQNRELVVVTDSQHVERVENFIKLSGIPNVTVVRADASLTLGDLRNMTVARAQGDILMQWDDDDLNDQLRIEIFVSTLIETGAAAVFLSRWLIWWPHRNIAAISNRRLWEGSIAIWREYMCVYPAMSRGEDTAALEFLTKNHLIVEIDAPHLYVYAITGQNTWNTEHFEGMIQNADCVFEGDEYFDLCTLLSNRLPIFEYHEYLNPPTKKGGADIENV
jgi:glycosyltransferase involved in cell wall biosynthesis